MGRDLVVVELDPVRAACHSRWGVVEEAGERLEAIARAGFADSTPDRALLSEAAEGGFASAKPPFTKPLEGGDVGFPAARRVFHGMLVAKLETDGALTQNELQGRLGWFHLQLNELEVGQLVDSAAAHGVIEPLEIPAEEGTSNELRWIATDRGRELSLSRGASLEDMLTFSSGALKQVQQGFKEWWAVALAALAVGGIGVASNDKLLAATAAFAFFALIVAQGVRGERDLKAAAEAWPRLRLERHSRWRWQTIPGRGEFAAFWPLAIAALLCAAWAVDSGTGLEPVFFVAAAVTAIAGALFYWLRLAPIANTWRRDRNFKPKARQYLSRIKRRIAALKPVWTWIRGGVEDEDPASDAGLS